MKKKSKNNSQEKNIIKTVIVIGAGASADFEQKEKDINSPDFAMPIGEELVKQISEFELELEGEIKRIRGYDINQKEIENIFEEIAKYNSIGKKGAALQNKSYWNDLSDKDFENIVSIVKDVESIRDLFFDKKEFINQNLSYNFARFVDFINATKDTCDKVNIKNYLRTHHSNLRHIFRIFSPSLYKAIGELIAKDLLTEFEKQQKSYFRYHLDLANLIKFYDPISIDNFLNSIEKSLINININGKNYPAQDEEETRKNLVNAGKELIAFFLLKAENKNIFNSKNKIWYRWFRESIINSYANKNFNTNSKKNPNDIIMDVIKRLQIISFNYDRSFNYFLKEKMNHNIKIGNNTINLAEEIQKKTHYPYGCLDIEIDNEKEFSKIEYGDFAVIKQQEKKLESFFNDFISHYAKRIFLIHEDRNNNCNKADSTCDIRNKIDNSLAEITKKPIKSAIVGQQFYFFGFGFIQENLNEITDIRLGYKTANITNRIIFYTNYRNSEKINNAVRINFSNINSHKKSELGVYDALNKDFSLII